MSSDDRGSRGGRIGTAVLATVLGVGFGLLAAPQTGTETRRALRKRLDAAREGLSDELEELEERSRPARRAVRAKAEELRRRGRKKYDETLAELEDRMEEFDEDEEDEGSSALGTALIVGAGIAAAAYFLTSERTATARERVREAAATVRDEAEARWERFQERRGNGHPFSDRGTRTDPAGSAPPSA
jgi:gas vesicle protein